MSPSTRPVGSSPHYFQIKEQDIMDTGDPDALRATESDDNREGEGDAADHPSDTLVPDPGTVACPNCDEPIRGQGWYEGNDLISTVYRCGNCGYKEQRP